MKLPIVQGAPGPGAQPACPAERWASEMSVGLDPATPYRAPSDAPEREPEREPSEDPLFGGLLILLVASVIRVVPAFLGRERFGVEPTLALLAVVVSGVELVRVACAWYPPRRTDRSR